jgi:hypothetical protein
MLSNQFEASNGHKLQKSFGMENCQNLILFAKFLGDFILERGFLVTSFVLSRVYLDIFELFSWYP